MDFGLTETQELTRKQVHDFAAGAGFLFNGEEKQAFDAKAVSMSATPAPDAR